MKIIQSLEFLKSNISDFELNVDTIISEEGEELKFDMHIYSIENTFIRISFQFVLNKTLFIDLINSNTNVVVPQTDNSDFINFFNNKNIRLLPYLKECNDSETNYKKLAELFLESRGFVIGKRFGF